MNTEEIISLIEIAKKDADSYIEKYYHGNDKDMINTKKALNYLKVELLNNPNEINERVLRAMHDMGVAAVKMYYDSPLESSLSNLIDKLSREIPEYKKLKPLGLDFGKGDPI
jgi:hypothetical protein